MSHQINVLKGQASSIKTWIDTILAKLYPKLPVINKDLHGKRAIVTGANSGVGFQISKRLAEQGAEVWLFCRTAEKGKATAEELKALTRNDRIFYDSVDFSKLREVREVIDRWAQKPANERIVDILINNAGLTVTEKRTTVDGFELTYAVNILSQFLLTTLLLNRTCIAPEARIIQMSSSGQYLGGPPNPDDLNSTAQLGQLKEGQTFGDNWLVPYWRSKGQQTVFTRMLHEKLARSGQYKDVVVSCCHPGLILTPMLTPTWAQETSKAGLSDSELKFEKMMDFMRKLAISPEEGAKTPLYLALADEPAKPHLRGKYWDRCAIKWTPAWMEDEGTRNRLWARWEEDAGVEASSF